MAPTWDAPVTAAIVGLLVAGGAWAAGHGARLVVRAVRRADEASASLWMIRGIRGLVVGVAAWALAGGLLAGQTWLLVFGGVFLAEELYETGVVILVLRLAAREPRPCTGHRIVGPLVAALKR